MNVVTCYIASESKTLKVNDLARECNTAVKPTISGLHTSRGSNRSHIRRRYLLYGIRDRSSVMSALA